MGVRKNNTFTRKVVMYSVSLKNTCNVDKSRARKNTPKNRDRKAMGRKAIPVQLKLSESDKMRNKNIKGMMKFTK